MHLRSVTLHPETYPTQDQYPFNLEILCHTGQVPFHTPVTLFVGENGTGKSTLLEALAYKCGIHIWRSAERTRVKNNPYEGTLSDYISVEWRDGRVPGSFFGSSIFQDFVKMLEEWAAADPGQLKYFGGKSLVTQSHGQSIMSFFRARYKIKGLYLMDEPETALSPKLAHMGSTGPAQFIIATHSPILLACPGAAIYSFDDIPIERVRYEDTEHYRIYRDFMEDREKYL
jgi:predicted ATPase